MYILKFNVLLITIKLLVIIAKSILSESDQSLRKSINPFNSIMAVISSIESSILYHSD